jgi:DNA-directed RNA polymerase subunit RPC12/RpoP
LKWLAYEKWSDDHPNSPNFECPHCEKDIEGLKYDTDESNCPHCSGKIFLSDMIGFHLEMGDDAAPQSLASAYMLVHETLLLFTGIRLYWEQGKFDTLSNCLFIKDGPLTLRGQYSKLVIPIRRFFEFATLQGIDVHVIGQEKSGTFFDHLQIISKHAAAGKYFLPSNDYIRQEIQKRPERGEPYGSRTNYGNKMFVKSDEYHSMVISIPTGPYKDTNSIKELIGAPRILKTIPDIRSYQYEGALLPLHLVHGIASLSTYPSAQVLRVFTEGILS